MHIFMQRPIYANGRERQGFNFLVSVFKKQSFYDVVFLYYFPLFPFFFPSPSFPISPHYFSNVLLVMFTGRRGGSNITVLVCCVHNSDIHTSKQNNYSYHTEIKDLLARVPNGGLVFQCLSLSLCFPKNSSLIYLSAACTCIFISVFCACGNA